MNSATALTGVLLAGQLVPLSALPFAVAAILRSAIGTAIGLRWMSPFAIRTILALILFAGAAQIFVRTFG